MPACMTDKVCDVVASHSIGYSRITPVRGPPRPPVDGRDLPPSRPTASFVVACRSGYAVPVRFSPYIHRIGLSGTGQIALERLSGDRTVTVQHVVGRYVPKWSRYASVGHGEYGT